MAYIRGQRRYPYSQRAQATDFDFFRYSASFTAERSSDGLIEDPASERETGEADLPQIDV